jgi:hypothetical protein
MPVAVALSAIMITGSAAYLRQDMAYARMARALKHSNLAEIKDAYETATSRWLPQPGEDLWCSRQFATLARAVQGETSTKAWALARTASARAEWAGDNPADAAYQSALLAVAANDPVTAEQGLRKAIQDAPTWYRPRLLLSQLLRIGGRLAESQAEGERALNLSGALRPALEQTLHP